MAVRKTGQRVLPRAALLCGLFFFAILLLVKSRFYAPEFYAAPPLAMSGKTWTGAGVIPLVPLAIPGFWPRVGGVDVFPLDRIPEKINGAIASYTPFGVKGLLFATYQDPKQEDRGVDLYLYEMGSCPDALGILADMRPPGVKRIGLGDGGWQDGTTIFFRRGPLCLQVLGRLTGAEMEEAVLALARELARVLPPYSESVVALRLLRVLPTKDRVPGSLAYVPRGAFDHPFLRGLFKADYGDEFISEFVMATPDFRVAENALRSWPEKIITSRPLAGIDYACMGQANGAYEGGAMHGGVLVGVIGASTPENAESRIRRLLQRLKEVTGGK